MKMHVKDQVWKTTPTLRPGRNQW